jgi:predicted transcriptional regulator
MKTITLKTQDDFFEQINQMALDANLSKSAFIRQAIVAYQTKIENIKMTKKMQTDSLRSRGLDAELIRDFEALDDEYLLPPWKD